MTDQISTSEYFTIDYEDSHISSTNGRANIDTTQISRRVCFVYQTDRSEQQRLWKIGDGAYGSVYKGIMSPGDEPNVAIKVLYDNSEIHPRQLLTLEESVLRQVFGHLVGKHFASKQSNGGQPDIQATDVAPRDRKNESTDNDELGILPEENTESEHISDNNNGAAAQDPIIDEFVQIVEAFKKSGAGSGNLIEKLRSFYSQRSAKPPEYFSDFWNDLEKRANSTAVYRYEAERDLNGEIRRRASKRDVKISERNIVKVEGGCDKFQAILDKAKYQTLKKQFEDASISYSDYVLVTKLYDYSLKDLLERPIKKQGDRNGYTVLRELPHVLRSRESLYILEQAVTGLKILHFVDIYHRDIKPGNIFILEYNFQNQVEIVLADLGNIPPDTDPKAVPDAKLTGDQERPERDYSRGTINYRGPEQKYYQDIADVEVVNLPKGVTLESIRDYLNNQKYRQRDSDALRAGGTEPGLVTVLIVKDPKFKNTLFAKDDTVLFSKDDTPRPLYIIEEVLEDSGTADQARRFGFVAFVLKGHLKDNEEKTQVEFYKQQKHRTDLFGIAAVLFDMLTIGHSAEQFYEGLRRFEGMPINTILQRYDTLKGGRIDEANLDFAELFSPFYNENDADNNYPKREIIEVLLKCMLYKSPGTYYDQAVRKGEGRSPAAQASELLEKDIQKLLREYNRECEDEHGIDPKKSILLHGEVPKGNSARTMFFSRRIDALQGLDRWIERKNHTSPVSINELELPVLTANRLMYGAYDFLGLVKFVRDKIAGVEEASAQESNTEASSRLYQILPSFITYQGSDGNIDSLFRRIAPFVELNKSLQNRSALIISSAANAFVPNEIASMRRGIRLRGTTQDSLISSLDSLGPSEPLRLTLKYRFLDAAFVERPVKSGDWIATGTHVWRIVKDPDADDLQPEITLEWIREPSLLSEENGGDNENIAIEDELEHIEDDQDDQITHDFGESKGNEIGNANDIDTALPIHIESDNIPQEGLNNSEEAENFQPALAVQFHNMQSALREIEERLSKDGYIDAIYYASVDPLKYYFEMLALYLQHLIFTYSSIAKTTRNRINVRDILYIFEMGGELEIVDSTTSTTNDLQKIHEEFVQIIVKLTLHEAKGSYYDRAVPDSDRNKDIPRKLSARMFASVHNDAEALYDKILKEILVLPNPESIVRSDYPNPFAERDELPQQFIKFVKELQGHNRIDIETIIKRSGQIEGEDLALRRLTHEI